jgi:hypothetical protein
VSAPEPKDLLAAYRAERGPTRAQADALWSRLRSDVARPSEMPRRVVPIAGRSRGRAVAIAAVVLAAAAVAVLALRPSGRRADSSAPADRSLSSHEASPDREAVASEAPSKTTRVDPPPEREAIAADEVETPLAPEPDAPPDTRAPVRRPGVRKPAVETPAPVTDSLAEETSLIRRARAALSAGRAAAAIDLLRDYEDRFASGRLAEEADAVRTMARCRQAPSDPGALAEGFVARHGGSLFRKQVEAACAAADEPDAG